MGLCETPECGFIVLQSAMADKGAQANDLCLSALSRRRWGLRDMAKGDSEKQPGDGKSGKAAKKVFINTANNVFFGGVSGFNHGVYIVDGVEQ